MLLDNVSQAVLVDHLGSLFAEFGVSQAVTKSMDEPHCHQALIAKLTAALEVADSLPADCLRASLLNKSCREAIQQALQAAHKIAANTQAEAAAAIAADSCQLSDLRLPLQLHILSFLPDNHKAWTGRLVCKAAYHMFKEFNCINLASDDTTDEMIVPLLQRRVGYDCPTRRLRNKIAERAAKQGDLRRLQFLHQYGCAWSPALYVAAVEGGHLAVLQWLRAQDPPLHWGPGVFAAAVQHGHLHIVEWLRAQDAPCHWTPDLCVAAAMGGHLDVLQWLRAQDPPCPWNIGIVLSAIMYDNLELLQWALAQDPPAPWHPDLCITAAQKGHLRLLKRVAERQPPLDWRRKDCLFAARLLNWTEMAEWLASLPPTSLDWMPAMQPTG